MPRDHIVFDLDGTISDPKEGIVRSINFALSEHGYAPRDETELVQYIGPPLDLTFQELTHSHDELFIYALVSKYRERYARIGYAENTLYDGVVESLETLAGQYPLAICTSKRKDFAEKILDRFHLSHLFQVVNGGDVGISKTQQLEELLSRNIIGPDSVMIGDRNADLIAANNNGLKSVGVLWGYGDYQELAQENPAMILDSPYQLPEIMS